MSCCTRADLQNIKIFTEAKFSHSCEIQTRFLPFEDFRIPLTSALCLWPEPSSHRGVAGQYSPVWPVPSSPRGVIGQYLPVWPDLFSMLLAQYWPVAREKTSASTRREAILASTGRVASNIPLAGWPQISHWQGGLKYPNGRVASNIQ